MKKFIRYIIFIILLSFSNNLFSWDIYMWWDIMLSRTVWAKIKKEWINWVLGDYNPIRTLTWSLLLFNLESPFSNPDKDKNERSFYFWANEKNVEILNKLRWNNNMILTLANNHIMNWLFNWLQLTVDTLDKNSIYYVWLSKNERIPYKMFSKAWKIYCINWYSYDWKMYINKKNKDKWYVNNLSEARDDLEKMNKDKCDYKIMMFHWGSEYKKTPSKAMKEQSHMLVDNWLDLLIWSHSHIFWETEIYKDKFIVNSLWNYIFDQNWWWDYCQKSMDCIFDNVLNKKTVPTYIWTGIFYDFLNNFNKIEHFKIDNWKLTKYDKLIGLIKYFLF